MRPILNVVVCLPLLVSSCSAYEKVSLSNFQKLGVSNEARESLPYVLKANQLHYTDAEGRINNNFYGPDNSDILSSSSALIEENIIVPKGARGVCVDSRDGSLTIDFGSGILVPFIIYDSYNRAIGELVVNERNYGINAGKRHATLYFDARGFNESSKFSKPTSPMRLSNTSMMRMASE